MFGLGLSLFQRAFRGGMSYVYDNLKLFFSFRKHQDTPITHASSGSTSFDGTNDYVSVADSDTLSFGDGSDDTALTISAWVKTDDVTNFFLINKGVYNSTGEYEIFVNGSNHLKIHLFDESVADCFIGRRTGDISANENSWTHLCFTYNGNGTNGGISIFINGVRSDTTDDSNGSYVAMENHSQPTLIGKNGTSYSEGSIANVAIWSRALSASEIQGVMYKKYSDLSSADQVSLVSWYGLDAESLGSELVSNGTFDTDTSGWTANSSTLSVDSARLKVDGSGGGSRRAYQDMTVVVGSTYRYTVDVVSGTSNARLRLGTTSDGSEYFNDTNNATGSYSFEVVATGTTMSVGLMCEAVGDCYFDNVSIKELTLDDSHSTNHGSPVGSTTNATVYGGNAPSKPRILDSAPDVVDNYGTLHSGTALSFDGSNDYVDAGASPRALVGSSSAFSVSAWINMDDDTNEYICGAMESGAERFYLRVVDASGIGYLRWGYGDSSSSDTDGVISLNEWHHVIWTYDTTNAKIYIDGELKNTTAVSGKTITNTDNLYIGVLNSNGTPANYLDGKISSFKIFNSALTLAQIQEMYLNPEQILPTGVSSSNLKLWLPLQEGSGTTNYDGSGNNNHGTISGATWVKAETDIAQVGLVRQNKPMVFDGANDYANMGDVTGLNIGDNNFSIASWIYKNGNTLEVIFSKGAFGVSGGYAFACGDGSSQDLLIQVENAGGTFDFANSSTVLNDGWNHVATTIDYSSSTGLKLYINGVECAYATQNDPTSLSSPHSGTGFNARIGANNAGGSNFDGLISEVAIWDEALTATEVTALYNSGTPLDATADSGNYASSDGLQGYWRNDGDTTWTDRSTNSNDGTVAGSPTSIVLTEGITSGRDSQGFYLKDTDENVLTLNGAEYVEVPDSDTLDTAGGFSLDFWVRPKSLANNDRMITKGVTGNGEWMISIGSGNTVRLYAKDDNGNAKDFQSTNTLSADTWSHISIVVNRTSDSVQVYKDGGNLSEGTSAGWDTGFNSTKKLHIGVNSSIAGFWNGAIDDIKYYPDKELTSAEVLKNYNAGLSKHRN